MPYFARIFEFDPTDTRVADVRPAHRAYVDELFESGNIAMSGPWETMDGALIIYDVADEAAARAAIAADPYTDAGVVTELSLRAWKVTTG